MDNRLSGFGWSNAHDRDTAIGLPYWLAGLRMGGWFKIDGRDALGQDAPSPQLGLESCFTLIQRQHNQVIN
ncbi:MAG: hypothetical protein AAGG44_01015, partial [Planctomycetota bacterium]